MDNANKIPEFLYDMLLKQYGEDILNKIIEGYSAKRNVTLRVNSLKTDVEKVTDKFTCSVKTHGAKLYKLK